MRRCERAMQMWFGRDGPFSHRKNWRAGHYGPVTPTMAVLIRRQGPGPGTRKGSGRAHGITGDPGSCRLVGGGFMDDKRARLWMHSMWFWMILISGAVYFFSMLSMEVQEPKHIFTVNL